jgi:urease accessory protein
MHLIHRMVGVSSGRSECERILLHAERRLFLKRRWRGVAEDGTEFGFDLESRLSHGNVIFQTPQVDYIICQQPEVIYELKTETTEQAALMGWKIGNLHFPVQIVPGAIWAMQDPAIKQLLEREGWPFTEQRVIFNPMRVVPHAS